MKILLEKRNELKTLFICTIIFYSIFALLEEIRFPIYSYTETWLDNHIPFIDWFVIPYLLWFGYIAIGFMYFLFKDKKGFYRTCFYIFGGMYICLIIYAIWPNAQNLRIEPNNQDMLHNMLSVIYQNDTSTNVCPSIHVYNSVMMYISLKMNKDFMKHKLLDKVTLLLTILICLSTVFVKQHAVIDVFYALGLCGIVYSIEKSISYTKYFNLKYIN